MTEEESIDKKIEELVKQKKELWLKEGKAYRCKECDKIIVKYSITHDGANQGLCYDCYSKKVKESKRKELMQTFKNAKIVDMKPEENPNNNILEVEEIVLEVTGERYIIKIGGYDEKYIEIVKGIGGKKWLKYAQYVKEQD